MSDVVIASVFMVFVVVLAVAGATVLLWVDNQLRTGFRRKTHPEDTQ